MDEIQGSAVEVTDPDNWDDITMDGLVDEDDEAGEGAAAEEPKADQPTEPEAEQKPEAEAEGQEPAKEADQLFEL